MIFDLSFSLPILVAALWALSTEMVEDSLVDLIYGHMYGWRALIYALIAASIILVTASTIAVYYALSVLVQDLSLVTKISAILLGLIGLFWIVTSLLGRESEVEEAKAKQAKPRTQFRSFLVVLQLVIIEELEILLIVIPLVVASHELEASLAAATGILISLSIALFLRKNFEKMIAGKLRYLKLASGTFLLVLALVLFLEL